jgi:hypothetical protein
MKVNDFHISYCTNIHSGESWSETFLNLKTYVVEVRDKLSPDDLFGIGLRLSAQACEDLMGNKELKLFKEWLCDNMLYVFTLNGFPYGNFHKERVKENVHMPDWQTEERVAYTMNLVNVLAEILPDDCHGSISTSPVSYKGWHTSEKEIDTALKIGAHNFLRMVERLHMIYEQTNKVIHIDIEPEPDGLIENSGQVIYFFKEYLIPQAFEYLPSILGVNVEEVEAIVKRHIRICYDVCHFALAYEDPEEAMFKLQRAGIGIGKVQVSSALKVIFAGKDLKILKEELSDFDEPIYLHQVTEKRKGGGIVRYSDLGPAIHQLNPDEAEEWLIHFHVPVFASDYKHFSSTQNEIIKTIQVLKHHNFCDLLEVETYTWEILPAELREDLVSSITREIDWLTKHLK